MKPCVRCGSTERYASSGKCAPCHRERGRQWWKDNPERKREANRQWYKDNHEAELERKRQYREANLEVLREASRQWYKDNHEKVRERKRQWYKDNPEKVREYREANPGAAARHMIKSYFGAHAVERLTETEKAELDAIYLDSRRRGLEVGHIVPLRPCRVCGASDTHRPGNVELQPHLTGWARGNVCKGCDEKETAA